MVKMGELSGNLDDTFASLAAHYEREEALTGSIRDALTYPLIMLGMLSAVLLVLIVKVMPVFDQVFQELGVEMSGAAAGRSSPWKRTSAVCPCLSDSLPSSGCRSSLSDPHHKRTHTASDDRPEISAFPPPDV